MFNCVIQQGPDRITDECNREKTVKYSYFKFVIIPAAVKNLF